MPKIYLPAAMAAAAFCMTATAAHAQAIKPPAPMRTFSAAEVAAVELPDTAFEATPADVETYDKYFYFHRDGTDFDTAFNDLSECDAVSSGINYYSSYDAAMGSYYYSQYGIGGAIGFVFSDALEDAIFGSTERRRIRRVNMRNCMGYKGYSRYGLEKERWQAFHFEEGFKRVDDDKRTAYLMKQARVASGPKPTGEELPR